MNKKGNFELVLGFFIIIAVLLVVGFGMLVGSAILNMVFDEITPELTNLGVVSSTNLSTATSYTLTPLNSFIQSWTWMTGLVYMLAIFGLLGIAIVGRQSTSKIYISFYVMLAILLIMGSILMSNIYEDFTIDKDDKIVEHMDEHALLSYMVLNSPLIFTVIIFLAGIILFSGIGQEEYY